MNNNICPRCGTENESQYTFCKNCGTPLNTAKNSAENNTYRENADYTNSQFTNNEVHFNDISQEEMALFIGKKSPDILPKFAKMEFLNSKVSWCWPVAILSFFFGVSGASLWFFYRKMYKPATLLAITGAILTIVTSVITGIITPELSTILNNLLESGDINGILNSINSIPPSKLAIYTVFTLLNDIIKLLTFILCGIFGFYIYKNHCIEKIHSFKTYQSQSPYYKLGLASTGGVSSGMLVLGIVIMIITNNISSVITTIINFL